MDLNRIITFHVAGRPQATARPRVLRTGRTYLPKSTKDAQRAVREAALNAQRQSDTSGPFAGAVRVSIIACFAYPKGTAKKRQLDWVPMIQRPDTENVAKTVLDGCNEVLYLDDAQVTELVVKKFRVVNPDEVGMFIEVEETA